jgi:hypothetical protein
MCTLCWSPAPLTLAEFTKAEKLRFRSLRSLAPVHDQLFRFAKYKTTEGLELGAVDKLLVGIFVGGDGEEEDLLISLDPDHPLYFSIVNL